MKKKLLLFFSLFVAFFASRTATAQCAGNDVIIYLDASGSMWEFADNVKSLTNRLVDGILSKEGNRVAIVRHSTPGTTDPGKPHYITITSDFTDQAAIAKLPSTYTFDHAQSGAYPSLEILENALDGVSDSRILGVTNRLNHDSDRNLVLLLVTEASPNLTGNTSSYLGANPSTYEDFAGAFTNYNLFKSERNATFVAIKERGDYSAVGSNNYNRDLKAAAAFTSKGGTYNGPLIAPNPGDPEGDGTLPRRLHFFPAGTKFALSDAQVDLVVKDLQVCTGPLPVKLATFNSATENNVVHLKWVTTEESKSDHFEVQHSIDGSTWEALAAVSAQGESKVVRNYLYTHSTPKKGNNYYRLKMVDSDGSLAFSAIIRERFDASIGSARVFPNPTSGFVKLESGRAGEVEGVELIGPSGSVFYKGKGRFTDGIDLKKYVPSKGLYILKINHTGGEQSTHKIVVTD